MASMRLPAGAPAGVASVFELAARAFALLAIGACSSSHEAPLVVLALTPSQAFNDAKTDGIIEGGPFRPAYDIDTVGGHAMTQSGAFSGVLVPSSGMGPSYALARVTWATGASLTAEIPKGIAAGTYDLLVRDPRGTAGTLRQGFVSRGADNDAPAVGVVEPVGGAVVNPGAEVPLAISADDGVGTVGELTWRVSDASGPLAADVCIVEPGVSRTLCRAVFVAPKVTQADVLRIHVEALDDAQNAASFESTVVVALPPVVRDVSPRIGPEAGGTAVVVSGDAFVDGTEVLVDGVAVYRNQVTFVDAHTLKVQMPAHEPGVPALAVRSGASVAAAGTFEYVGLPVVLAVAPATGPLAGNIPIVVAGRNFRDAPDGTKIQFGPHDGTRVDLGCQEVVNANRITGVLPPGAGFVSVFASDAVGGSSELPGAFTYLGDETPDAGAGPPKCLKQGAPP
jgi:hypothetical protein